MTKQKIIDKLDKRNAGIKTIINTFHSLLNIKPCSTPLLERLVNRHIK